jgi:hypothetical protein
MEIKSRRQLPAGMTRDSAFMIDPCGKIGRRSIDFEMEMERAGRAQS